MKELSIEEKTKAKAYDEAIKRAEAVIKVAQNQKEVYDCVTTILPELKEDNDERIRKALICGMNALKENQRSETFATIPIDDCIAWLEKQGESEDRESDDELTWLKTFIEEEAYYLSMDIRDEIDRKKLIKLQNALAWLEKQGEQPVDKIEPKFKVRDWLQYRDAEPFLVEEITEQGYCNGNSCLPFEWEDEIRPWTIQDAKDGDVLCYENKNDCRIFIYKNGHIDYHCCYSNGHLTPVDSFFVVPKHLLCYIHPATKEQRELLFEKMKEADYAWDGEEKELKKIEPKALNSNKAVT